MTNPSSNTGPGSLYGEAPNLSIDVMGTKLSYRDVGPRDGVPLILFNHWGAVLDNFDPRIIDGLAREHRVIATNYRGIGGSGGTAPVTIGEMARDAMLGFSLGGFVAQDIVAEAPGLVRKLILTGTGPAGGKGIDRVGAVSWPLMIKAALMLRDPKVCLFFTSTENGRQAARAFLNRLKERKVGRDKGPTPSAFLRQLKAIRASGRQAPQDLGKIKIPVLIANGDNDVMVPTENSLDMARRISGAQLEIYKDAGHGGIFQYHADFVPKALSFLAAPDATTNVQIGESR